LGKYSESFQSTLPVGGATVWIRYGDNINQISIHAPRGGSDGRSAFTVDLPPTFLVQIAQESPDF
ncbi:MAG: hypothetical protein ACI3XR_05420, partial [Eubacteriales bacterium]